MLDAKFKVVLAGESGVGKTSLVRRFVLDQFGDEYLATVGAKVTKGEVEIQAAEGPIRVALAIWDVAGSPTLRDLLQDAYFAHSQGVLLVFDLTQPETLAALEWWAEAIQREAGPVPMVLVANKVDLASPQSQATGITAFVAQHKCQATAASAKTGQGVPEAFKRLAQAMVQAAAVKPR